MVDHIRQHALNLIHIDLDAMQSERGPERADGDTA
jgi:hypothetical protein